MQTAKGSQHGQLKMILPEPYHEPRAVCLFWYCLSYQATIVFHALKTIIWYIQYNCTDNIVNRIWSIYALFLFEEVNHLFCILLIFYESQIVSDIQQILSPFTNFLTVLYSDILLWILMILVCFKEGFCA
jgi:hypothetical protein